MVKTDPPARFALWPMPDLGSTPGVAGDGDTVRANAFEEGYAAGYEQARRETDDSVQHVVTALTNAVARFDQTRAGLRAEMRPVIVQLAMAMARQVIQREIEIDDQFVLKAVERMLTALDEQETVQIHLHPEDLACTESYRVLEDWTTRHEWIADASMERGSCVIESPGRFIDGTMDAILNDFARRLADV